MRTNAPFALISIEDRKSNPARARGASAWPKHARLQSTSLSQPDKDGEYNIEHFRYLGGTKHIGPDDGNTYESLMLMEKRVGDERNLVGYRVKVLDSGKKARRPECDSVWDRTLL